MKKYQGSNTGAAITKRLVPEIGEDLAGGGEGCWHLGLAHLSPDLLLLDRLFWNHVCKHVEFVKALMVL